MSELTLSKPTKFENVERYTVYIVKSGLLTGVAGEGNTPQEATRNAQGKIEKGEGELKE
ncbi:hypothetical protein LCGC14_1301620 [marine sediment metagenome]|uniref:Uncharacterized protein n=1 Tax=marine sediment metagenome TaxID=412755 RepID=A0A0F9N5Z6_9ZZZZ